MPVRKVCPAYSTRLPSYFRMSFSARCRQLLAAAYLTPRPFADITIADAGMALAVAMDAHLGPDGEPLYDFACRGRTLKDAWALLSRMAVGPAGRRTSNGSPAD